TLPRRRCRSALAFAAEVRVVAIREIEADRAVALEPRQWPPVSIQAHRGALHDLRTEALHHIPRRVLKVFVQRNAILRRRGLVETTRRNTARTTLVAVVLHAGVVQRLERRPRRREPVLVARKPSADVDIQHWVQRRAQIAAEIHLGCCFWMQPLL